MVLGLEGARVIHVKMRFISVLVYSPGGWVTHVTFHLSGVQVDHCRCQQTKIWWTPVGHQSLRIADFKLSNPVLWTEVVITILFSEQYTLNVRSRGKQLVLFSQESWCFPRRSRGKHQDSRENKTNWFPEGSDIKCFVIFLELSLQQQQKNNRSERKRTKTVDSVLNTNLILKSTEWMIYKQKYFPYIICIFSLH